MRYFSLIVWMSALLWAQQSPSWGRAYVDSAASVVPQYVVSTVSNSGNGRVPYVAYLTIRGLEPNTTYRYVVRMDDNTNPATNLNVNAGAGNPIYYDPATNTFNRVTSPSLNTAGQYGLVTTVVEYGQGTAHITFIIEPTVNARFRTDRTVYPKVFFLEDASQNDSAVVYADKTPVKPIAFGSSCPNQDTCGSFFYDSITPGLVSSKFVFLYDEYLLGPNPPYKRPIAGAIIEPTGINYPTSYLSTYLNEVAAKPGRWGTIIPNTLPNGIRSIIYHERGHLAYPSHNLAGVGIYDRDGSWPSGYNTANPNNGDAAAGLLMSLIQPLRSVSGIRPPDAFERGAFIWRNLSTNPLCTDCDGFLPITNDYLLNSAFSSYYSCTQSPGSGVYSEDCAYGLYGNAGLLPSPPADSTLPPVSWPMIGGPGWRGQFGDSLIAPVQLLYDPLSGTFLLPTFDPYIPGCSACPAIDCDEVFSSFSWTFKLHPVAFSNEAGNLVRNYNYFDQIGGVINPFHSVTVSGPFSAPGAPIGLTETSGADLNAINVNTTPQLSIRAILPYEVQIYAVFPFQYGTFNNNGYLEWELVNASNGNIISFGNSLSGWNNCLPYVGECTYETTVPVGSLTAGTYRIRGRIIPPTCPGGSGLPTPIETDSITFTVTVGTSLSRSLDQVLIRTTSSAWIVEGVAGEAILYDSQGRRIWSGKAESGRLSIPRSSLRPGLYLLVTESPTNPQTYRLLHIE